MSLDWERPDLRVGPNGCAVSGPVASRSCVRGLLQS